MSNQREPLPRDQPTRDSDVDEDEGSPALELNRAASVAASAVFLVLLPAFSILYLWQALTIPLPGRALVVSPRGFPALVGALMVAVTICLAIQEVRAIRRRQSSRSAEEVAAGSPEDGHEELARVTSWRDLFVALGALVAYVALFQILGVIITTFAFVFGLSTYLAPKKTFRNAVVAVLVSAGIYYLFAHLLGVVVPTGPLSGIL